MPEGDTIRNMVVRFRPHLVGQRIRRAASRWPSAAFGLVGRTVVELEPTGKNLVIHLDDDTAIRVHLGMRGRWRWLTAGESHRGSLGNVSLLLELERGTAVCTGAPTVERFPLRARAIHPVLARLGPDLLAEQLDLEAILARVPYSPSPTVAEVLLDQRVACGIGNVYKSEVLFERRVHPYTPPAVLGEHLWRELYLTARAQMTSNVARSPEDRFRPRQTTQRPNSQPYAVYGRAGRPCTECGTLIIAKISGQGVPRWTWWCPSCQGEREPAAPG